MPSRDATHSGFSGYFILFVKINLFVSMLLCAEVQGDYISHSLAK